MQTETVDRRDALRAIVATLVAAVLFEALTTAETQDKAVWAATPWRADPYHTALTVTQFVVPALAAVIAARLFVWRAPGAPDRARQMVHASATLVALVGVTLVVEWVAVIGGVSPSPWISLTWLLIGGLTLSCVVVGAVAWLLLRSRGAGGMSNRWQQDWLGDFALLCDRVPGLRGCVTATVADRVRRRAMTMFVVVSVLVGAAIAAAQAMGEQLTDPLLIAWYLVALAAATLAVCVICNAIAGFIARPPRSRSRRVVEASVVTGCGGFIAGIAFHAPLWQLVGTGPLTVPALTAVTLGTGLATCLITAALLATSLGRRIGGLLRRNAIGGPPPRTGGSTHPRRAG